MSGDDRWQASFGKSRGRMGGPTDSGMISGAVALNGTNEAGNVVADGSGGGDSVARGRCAPTVEIRARPGLRANVRRGETIGRDVKNGMSVEL